MPVVKVAKVEYDWDKIKKYLIWATEQTRVLLEKAKAPPASEPALTPKQKAVVNILKKHSFGGHDAAIQSLMSVIMDIPKHSFASREDASSVPTVVGAVVVPLQRYHSHNYTVGKPTIWLPLAGCGIRMNGTVGNNLFVTRLREWADGLRFATYPEIEQMCMVLRALREWWVPEVTRQVNLLSRLSQLDDAEREKLIGDAVDARENEDDFYDEDEDDEDEDEDDEDEDEA